MRSRRKTGQVHRRCETVIIAPAFQLQLLHLCREEMQIVEGGYIWNMYLGHTGIRYLQRGDYEDGAEGGHESLLI